jgi:hypothetical protein
MTLTLIVENLAVGYNTHTTHDENRRKGLEYADLLSTFSHDKRMFCVRQIACTVITVPGSKKKGAGEAFQTKISVLRNTYVDFYLVIIGALKRAPSSNASTRTHFLTPTGKKIHHG